MQVTGKEVMIDIKLIIISNKIKRNVLKNVQFKDGPFLKSVHKNTVRYMF